MITFEEFKNSNARPGLEEINLSSIQYKTLSEIQEMIFSDVKKLNPIVVCDNPIWLAKSTFTDGRESYYSCDGEYIWSIPRTFKRVTRQILNEKKLIIVDHADLKYSNDTNLNDLKENKEELNMNEINTSLEAIMSEAAATLKPNASDILEPNKSATLKSSEPAILESNKSATLKPSEPATLEPNKSDTLEPSEPDILEPNSLEAIMQQASKDLDGDMTPKMEIFSDAEGSKKTNHMTDEEKEQAKAKKQAEKERMASVIKAIQNEATSVAPNIDLTLLSRKWKALARLICFVTPTDKRQSIVAVKVPQKKQDKKLRDNVPEEIRLMYNSNRKGDIPDDYYVNTFRIKAREGKPGKPCGVIARIPAFLKGCSLMDFTKSVALEGAKTDSDATVIEAFTMTDFEQKLTLVGGTILEAEETALENGKAGEIELVATYPRDTSASTDGTLVNQGFVFSKKLVRVGNGNKTPLHDRNYFPLTTYETIDISGEIPDDKLKDLNQYTFNSFFSASKNDKQVASKYEELDDDDKVHIRRGKDGIIESDYITNDASRRVKDLKVVAFYNKDVERSTINLAVKTRSPKSDGSLGSPQFIKYTAYAEDKMKDATYFAKSALGSSQFAHIVDLVGEEILNPTTLKEVFKRGSTSTTVSKKLSSSTVRDLTLAKLYGGLTGYDIAGFTFE